MPVKSVIIGKESSYMNQVTFNQCSGRAGRRGLEVFGHVVFFDVKLPRIYRYLNAQVPSIRGSMGITPSFILRLLIAQNELMHTGISEKVDAFNSLVVEQILSPLLSSVDTTTQNNEFSNRMKYLFRYNIEFLYRTGLINSKGQPRLSSGIISHLHYTEPYNMLFAYFLEKGLFHSLLEQSQATEEDILVILCYLFGRYKTTWMSKKNTLPKPPAQFIHYANRFNEEVLNIYSDSVRATTDDCEKEVLPYSRIGTWCAPRLRPDQDLHASISSYARISGNESRRYHNLQHFVSTMRHTSITSTSLIPFASFYEENMSAFIVKYFQTQSRREVIKSFKFMNKMELDKRVTDFSQKISALYNTLSNQCILDSRVDPFMKCLQHIITKFRDLVGSEENEDEDESTDSDTDYEDILDLISSNKSQDVSASIDEEHGEATAVIIDFKRLVSNIHWSFRCSSDTDSNSDSDTDSHNDSETDIDSDYTDSNSDSDTTPTDDTQSNIVFNQANLLVILRILFKNHVGIDIQHEDVNDDWESIDTERIFSEADGVERDICDKLKKYPSISIPIIYAIMVDLHEHTREECAKRIVDEIKILFEEYREKLAKPDTLKKAAELLTRFISSLDDNFTPVYEYTKQILHNSKVPPKIKQIFKK
jgi:hypothetical protein